MLSRELGLLAFNRRVLAQAVDDTVPLLERLRFITIISSNLDELFEIRVAGLVAEEAHALVAEQYRLLNEVVLPALAREGIVFLRREDWSAEQRDWIRDYFFKELLPVLTPIGLDPAHPFPRVLNKSLNFVIELEGRDAFGPACRCARGRARRQRTRPPAPRGCARRALRRRAESAARLRRPRRAAVFRHAGARLRGSARARATRQARSPSG